MKDKSFPLLTGTIEADETYVGGKPRGHKVWKQRETDEIQMGLRPKREPWQDKKAVVFGMKERDGSVRTMVVSKASASVLRPLLAGIIDLEHSRLMTDKHPAYRLIRQHLPHDRTT